MAQITQNFLSSELSTRISMGHLGMLQRIRLVWFVLTGQVVKFSGSMVLSTHAANSKLVDTIHN